MSYENILKNLEKAKAAGDKEYEAGLLKNYFNSFGKEFEYPEEPKEEKPKKEKPLKSK